jgi:regulatory protein
MNETHQNPPTEQSLRDAAIAHLARYASTGVGLARVLERRVDNWARRARRYGDADQIRAQAAEAKALIEPIVVRLVQIGAINDASYAASRTRSLARGGKSNRAVQAHLAAKGVPAEITRAATIPDAEREYGACLTAAKKRRLGPFGAGITPELRRREMAALARNGFPERLVREIFELSREEAEEKLIEWRNKVE